MIISYYLEMQIFTSILAVLILCNVGQGQHQFFIDIESEFGVTAFGINRAIQYARFSDIL